MTRQIEFGDVSAWSHAQRCESFPVIPERKRGIPVYVFRSYRQAITVHLFGTAEVATAAKQLIDDTMCGELCRRKHQVVQLELRR